MAFNEKAEPTWKCIQLWYSKILAVSFYDDHMAIR